MRIFVLERQTCEFSFYLRLRTVPSRRHVHIVIEESARNNNTRTIIFIRRGSVYRGTKWKSNKTNSSTGSVEKPREKEKKLLTVSSDLRYRLVGNEISKRFHTITTRVSSHAKHILPTKTSWTRL